MKAKVEPMMIDERLRAIADALPDDGRVSFTRTDLLNMLAAETQPPHQSEVAVDLTVTEVAQLLHRSPVTVRTWCATGELPGAYRLHGREWRIPSAAVDGFQQRQAEQHVAHRDSATGSATTREADLSAWRAIKSNAQGRPKKYRGRLPSLGGPAA